MLYTKKAKGLSTRNTSRSQEIFGYKSKCTLQKMPRGCRLETRVEAKKPSAKNQSVYYTIRKPRGCDSKHESKPRNLRPKNKVYALHQESQGAVDSKHESKPRNLRLKIKVHNKQAKKPSAKTKYKLPKSLEQDCKGGGRRSRTILQPSSQRLRHFKTMKPHRNKSLGGGRCFRNKKLLSLWRSTKAITKDGTVPKQEPPRRMEHI